MLSGCYKYTPMDQRVVPPGGEEVRVYVTRAGAAELAEIVPDAEGAGSITGVVQSVENDDLLMRVTVGERQEGLRVINMMQTIRVPRGEILTMERREVNKLGTGLLVAGGAALGVGVVLGIIEAFGVSSGGPEDPPPEDFTVTLGGFSFPWGR